MDRNSSITEIKGIGEKTAALFQKLDIETVGDILLHYPRTYVQFPEAKQVSEVTEEGTAAVIGRVMKVPVVRRTRSMPIYRHYNWRSRSDAGTGVVSYALC